MAKKSADDDLLGGAPSGGDDLLGGAPAKGKGKGKAAPAKKAAGKPAAKGAKAAAPAKKAAKPKAEATERSARGEGKFYMTPEEKADLAKKIGTLKSPVSTKELAEKYQVETWKVRRAINEVLVPENKGKVEKVGNVLQYTPKK